jgi:hypothetical protein
MLSRHKKDKDMKINSLLTRAGQCKTEADAQSLLDSLLRVFGDAKPFSHLDVANQEAYMEGDKPFVHFELNRVYSEYYITMIRPEIRFGELAVSVVTNYMKDGLGMQSQSWEAVEGMDDVVTARPEQTVAQVVALALQCALANHQQLLERLGVPGKAAKKAAKASW